MSKCKNKNLILHVVGSCSRILRSEAIIASGEKISNTEKYKLEEKIKNIKKTLSNSAKSHAKKGVKVEFINTSEFAINDVIFSVNDNRDCNYSKINLVHKNLKEAKDLYDETYMSKTRLGKIKVTINGQIGNKNLRYKMLEICGKYCASCGVTNVDKLSIDHIWPQSLFPSIKKDLLNLQPMCRKCNGTKSNIHNTDYRGHKQILNLVQLVLSRSSEPLIELDISERNLTIIKMRILRFTYSQIKSEIPVSLSTISRVINMHIPGLNAKIKDFMKKDQKLRCL